jgi:lysylphosphatidylglycerol synthetase-like protein (DUF2156 family)
VADAVVVILQESVMGVLLAILLIVLLLGGLGFVLHVLWWIALILLGVWLVGLFMRRRSARR